MYQLNYRDIEIIEIELAFEAGFYFTCSGDNNTALVFKEGQE